MIPILFVWFMVWSVCKCLDQIPMDSWEKGIKALAIVVGVVVVILTVGNPLK